MQPQSIFRVGQNDSKSDFFKTIQLKILRLAKAEQGLAMEGMTLSFHQDYFNISGACQRKQNRKCWILFTVTIAATQLWNWAEAYWLLSVQIPKQLQATYDKYWRDELTFWKPKIDGHGDNLWSLRTCGWSLTIWKCHLKLMHVLLKLSGWTVLKNHSFDVSRMKHNHPTEIEPFAVQHLYRWCNRDPLSGRSYVYHDAYFRCCDITTPLSKHVLVNYHTVISQNSAWLLFIW